MTNASATVERPERRFGPIRRGTAPVLGSGLVFVVALAMRVGIVLRSHGGYRGRFDYDSTVYYAAADALIHGRMPYSDFVLLHPPALMLVLTPFAWLGTETTDHHGFIAGCVAFQVLGSLIAALLVPVGRRAGLGPVAAVGGGLVYALWPGAAADEISTRLEPLGNLFTVLGLLLLFGAWRDRDRARTGTLVAAGALFGAAAVTKIWWVAPLLVVIVWQAFQRDRGRRRAVALLGGAAASMLVIAGPFFVNAPGAMWRMLVTDQFGRPSDGTSLATRLKLATWIGPLTPGEPKSFGDIVLAIVLVVLLAAAVRTWIRRPVLRLVVVLGVVELAVLLAAPISFASYSDFIGPALALVVAGGLDLAAGAREPAGDPAGDRSGSAAALSPLRVVAPCVIALVSVVALVAAIGGEYEALAPVAVSKFPGIAFSRVIARDHLRCVMSDTPGALIGMNVLSSDLAHGCENLVDVSGSTYDRDRPPGGFVRRPRNDLWQRSIFRYLTSGNAELAARRSTGLSRATLRKLRTLPILLRIRGYRLRLTDPRDVARARSLG